MTQSDKTNRDPVCRMSIKKVDEDLRISYQDRDYFFCSRACRDTFEENPEKFLKSGLKKKSWFGRFLEQLARSNEEEFGHKGPGCCH